MNLTAENPFCYFKDVAFYETDAMGVVHHSNYLRYFEEARIAWLKHHSLQHLHHPLGPITFAVLESSCSHRHPAFFADRLRVNMQGQRNGLRVLFEYAIFSEKFDGPICVGHTLLIPVDTGLKPVKLPKPIIQQLEKEKWTETWRSSL